MNNTNKKNKGLSGVRRSLLPVYGAAVFGLLGMGAVAQEPVAQAAPLQVKVYFNGACPIAVDNFVLEATQQPPQQVQWQSTDAAGANISKSFDVYFDPFVGAPISSNPQGTTPPRTVSQAVPKEVLYKYSIVAEGCDQPLDPFLRVR